MSKRAVLLSSVALALVAAMALAAACGGGSSGSPSVRAIASATRTEGLPPQPTFEIGPLYPIAHAPPTRTPANPTPPMAGFSVAYNARDAMGFARDVYYGCPPFCSHDIQSVEYVEATVGKLRQLFGPGDATKWRLEDPGSAAAMPGADSSWHVWAIVAHGNFTSLCVGCGSVTTRIGNSFWVFVLKDRLGLESAATDIDYDISQLGEVHQVTLPFPKWPTPVDLTPAP